MNTFEQPPQEENMEALKERVVESLRNNPEDLESLHTWLDAREQEVNTPLDTLKLNIEVAEVYESAGLKEGAKEAYEHAAYEARQEYNNDTLFDELMGKASGLSEEILKEELLEEPSDNEIESF